MVVNGDDTFSLTHTIPDLPQAGSHPEVILEEVLEHQEENLIVNHSCGCHSKSLIELMVGHDGIGCDCPAHSSSLCSGSEINFLW